MEFLLIHPASDAVHAHILRHCDGTIIIRNGEREFWVHKNDLDFRDKVLGVLNVLTYPHVYSTLKWQIGLPDGSVLKCPSLPDALMVVVTYVGSHERPPF
jgi:hypothetical protein